MTEIGTTSCLTYQLPASSSIISDGVDGNRIQERLTGFNQMLRQLHLATNKSNDTLQKLSKLQRRLKVDPDFDTPENRAKLTALYRSSLKDTETEAELSRQAMTAIFDIRRLVRNRQKSLAYGMNLNSQLRRGQLLNLLNDSANTLPLFISKSAKERPPPLCGSIPPERDYMPKCGDLVAALTRPGPNQEDSWILAEVVHYNKVTKKFEVDDIDEEQKETRHMLSRRRIVPLPTMRINPQTDPEGLFPKGTKVLALYPQTTCFYTAVVQEPPKTSADCYQLLFEDNGYPEGFSPPLYVPQRYVIPNKVLKEKGGGGGGEGKSATTTTSTTVAMEH